MTAFAETWTDTLWRTHVRLNESEVIRVTLINGTAIWVSAVMLETLLPDNTYHVTIWGTTENNQSASCKYLEDEDYPEELLPLIPEIIGVAMKELEEEFAQTNSGWTNGQERTEAPKEI